MQGGVAEPDIQIQVLHNDPLFLRAHIRNVSIAYVNGLRRAIHAEVPTLAIDSVQFVDNQTTFFEEFIAHRLGLVPLCWTGDIDDYSYWYSCDNADAHDSTGGCPRCQVRGTIRVANPVRPDAENGNREITDADLVFENQSIVPMTVRRGQPAIPILSLAPGDSFEATVYVRKGKGKLHAKWCPSASVVLRPQARVALSDGLSFHLQHASSAQICENFLRNVCARKVFSLSQGVVKIAEESCVFCSDCTDYRLPVPALRDNAVYFQDDGQVAEKTLYSPVLVTQKPDEYVLEIESLGSMDASAILLRAIKEVDDCLETVLGEVLIGQAGPAVGGDQPEDDDDLL